jgi:transposase-like protein
MRVAPPRAAEAASAGERDGGREAHRPDCVRIVHKHMNLLAHAPERLHEEISADYTDMIYAATAKEIETRRKAFLRKWRLKCRAVADSLEEAGEALFAFTRLPSSQWKSARTTSAIERLHEGSGHCPEQAPHQDADRAALGRDRGHAVLGAARLRA